MDNAIKYSNKKSNINVSLYNKNNKKIFDIYNKCEAISIEDKHRLFDRFYRIDSSRSRETGGYGIGLSIVKSIVNMHKGKIDIITDNEGVMFRIIFTT